jgi:hypothetical protein
MVRACSTILPTPFVDPWFRDTGIAQSGFSGLVHSECLMMPISRRCECRGSCLVDSLDALRKAVFDATLFSGMHAAPLHATDGVLSSTDRREAAAQSSGSTDEYLSMRWLPDLVTLSAQRLSFSLHMLLRHYPCNPAMWTGLPHGFSRSAEFV